jgi:hypothetical protein
MTGRGMLNAESVGCHETDVDVLSPRLRPLRSTDWHHVPAAKRLAAKRQLTAATKATKALQGVKVSRATNHQLARARYGISETLNDIF